MQHTRSSEFLQKVKQTIEREVLFAPQDVILVGMSGGADSVALLYALHQLGYACVVVHCNFNLRGDESARDHTFARLLAASLALPFHEVHFATEAYAAQHGISIEMACRELRYEWFEDLRIQLGAQAVAVGHHQDDSIETFFLNLLRGTGIAGLTGIKYQNQHVVRPLLDVTRQEIEGYLKVQSLDYVTDSTNLETIYKRNQVRLELLPLLQNIYSQARTSVVRTMSNLQQVEKIYQQALSENRTEIVFSKGDHIYIHIPSLLSQEAARTVLYEYTKPYGVRANMLTSLFRSFESISGKQFYTSTHHLVKDREFLIISPLNEEKEEVFLITEEMTTLEIPFALEQSFLDYFPGFVLPKEPHIAVFDACQIRYPLVLRKWRQGDRFKPLGMKGFKKVSDYFSDHKFSLIEKKNTWVMESEGEIVWIVNHRIDDRVKVSAQTEKLILLRVALP